MKRWFGSLLLITLAACLYVQASYACSCATSQDPAIRFMYAESVFTATIMEKLPLPFEREAEDGNWFSYIHSVAVSEVWKGDVSPIVDIYHGRGFDCQTRFEIGEKYLIYAYNRPHPETGELLQSTHFCKGNMRVVEARRFLLWLGQGRSPFEAAQGYLNNYPNPFAEQTQIIYDVSEDGFVEMDLYDQIGRHVRRVLGEDQLKGVYTMSFGSEGLAAGVYVCRLQVQGGPPTLRTLVLAR